MRLVFAIVLLAGLGLAGFAVFMTKDFIAASQAQLAIERATHAPAIATRPVLVATRDLRYGERLTEADIREVSFPEDAIPVGAFESRDALFPAGTDTPRSVLRAMSVNEPMLASKLTEPGVEAGVSARLSPGKRAFAIRVDVSSGVSGFLRPGDRVDVYWTGQIGQQGDVTKLIQAGVKLVAIDQSADEDVSEAVVARTVTVEATPRDVAALAQAQSTGTLALSLVGVEDDTIAEMIEVDQRELLGLAQEERRAEIEPAKTCSIRTRRGSEVVDMPIPCTN
ncbi:Flp pilus assembly protein CpaB [Palleronia sp. LCG004]|uniref:Flp pilus assembly protein CpaB n=1 Tax=Palleronia sp. LCG004 TaxID=3079304 RepID=UPI002942B144|nr:Flp pilus assembly protein CpaB [Palleronia sp. LCG004]WOI55690.1 Flp pilus assembly protein CpaB [Palleronia sp. LCG004]